jgi:hypothetical protein
MGPAAGKIFLPDAMPINIVEGGKFSLGMARGKTNFAGGRA